MIYGDNPNKINEREDALGLKTYTYAPSISSIMQSGNLYVYCANNPISYLDFSGYKLIWFGEIHNAVVNEIANEYGLLKEQFLTYDVDGKTKNGRADLVSYDGNIWEVKSGWHLMVNVKAGEQQLSNYTSGKLNKHSEITNLKKGDTRIKDGSFIYESRNGASYKVSYRNNGNGIIVYNYNEIKKQQPSTVNVIDPVLNVLVTVVIIAITAFAMFNGAPPVVAKTTTHLLK